jgi:hypothetical protein
MVSNGATRARLSGENCAAAGGYRIDNSRELTRVLGQIEGNRDLEADMAAEAVAEYMRHRLPDLAVMFPRHRFGFVHRDLQACVSIWPAVYGQTSFSSLMRHPAVYRKIRRWRGRFYEAKLLAEHLDDVALELKCSYHRVLPPIGPFGIEAADPCRVNRVLDRVRRILKDEPVARVGRQKSWIRAGEDERRQMLRDCGWL